MCSRDPPAYRPSKHKTRFHLDQQAFTGLVAFNGFHGLVGSQIAMLDTCGLNPSLEPLSNSGHNCCRVQDEGHYQEMARCGNMEVGHA